MENLMQEEFEVIEFLGQRMLFDNGRINQKDVPDGVYVNHLRESDSGNRFCTVEKHVLVNHGGSILSKQPIDYKKKDFIKLTRRNEPNFLGEDMTLQQFMSE